MEEDTKPTQKIDLDDIPSDSSVFNKQSSSDRSTPELVINLDIDNKDKKPDIVLQTEKKKSYAKNTCPTNCRVFENSSKNECFEKVFKNWYKTEQKNKITKSKHNQFSREQIKKEENRKNIEKMLKNAQSFSSKKFEEVPLLFTPILTDIRSLSSPSVPKCTSPSLPQSIPQSLPSNVGQIIHTRAVFFPPKSDAGPSQLVSTKTNSFSTQNLYDCFQNPPAVSSPKIIHSQAVYLPSKSGDAGPSQLVTVKTESFSTQDVNCFPNSLAITNPKQTEYDCQITSSSEFQTPSIFTKLIFSVPRNLPPATPLPRYVKPSVVPSVSATQHELFTETKSFIAPSSLSVFAQAQIKISPQANINQRSSDEYLTPRIYEFGPNKPNYKVDGVIVLKAKKELENDHLLVKCYHLSGAKRSEITTETANALGLSLRLIISTKESTVTDGYKVVLESQTSETNIEIYATAVANTSERLPHHANVSLARWRTDHLLFLSDADWEKLYARDNLMEKSPVSMLSIYRGSFGEMTKFTYRA